MIDDNWVMDATSDKYDAWCEAREREIELCDCEGWRGKPPIHAVTCALVLADGAERAAAEHAAQEVSSSFSSIPTGDPVEPPF